MVHSAQQHAAIQGLEVPSYSLMHQLWVSSLKDLDLGVA